MKIYLDLTIIGIDFESGIVKLDEIDKTLCKNTCLVTIMLANNETGVIQPLARISDLIRFFFFWLHKILHFNMLLFFKKLFKDLS